MSENENRLDQLFAQAKEQTPKTSYKKVRKHLVLVTSAGLFAIIVKWWLNASKYLKIGIMMCTLTTVVVSIYMAASTNVKSQTAKMQTANTERVNVVEETTTQNVVAQKAVSNEAKSIKKPVQIEELPLLKITPKKDKGEIIIIEDETNINKANKEKEKNIVSFIISEKTTEAEMQKIKAEAEAVGIDFNYNLKIKRGKIKRITLKASLIRNGNKSKKNVYINNSDSFSFTIGWKLNEEGEAIKFIGDPLNSVDPCDKC